MSLLSLAKSNSAGTPPWRETGHGQAANELFRQSSNDSNNSTESAKGVWNAVARSLPSWWGLALKTSLGAILVLYVLNQKHMLPLSVSRVVSKTLFWPTFPITYIRKLNSWVTRIDDTVILGGAPVGFLNEPQKLVDEFEVRGVINMCAEFKGPAARYKKLGIEELWIPTADHFEPTVADMETAVDFIQKHKDEGTKVYIHCRAGHGRSAAIVFAWLLSQDPEADLQDLNKYLCTLRDVRKTLWKQPNILIFRDRLLLKKQGKKLKPIDKDNTIKKDL